MNAREHTSAAAPADRRVRIAGREVGRGCPCLVIAEAGVNHNGDLDLARRMVDAAAAAGADAVKFQTYKTDHIYTAHTPKAGYMHKTTSADETIMEMARRLELPFEAFSALSAHCRRRGIMFLSSPFDEPSADFLAGINVPVLKLPSGELTNLPYLEHVAQLGLPLIVSTGMAGLGEVETALAALERAGNRQVVLLHCVSNYPADPSDANLRAMAVMAAAFGVPVGFSDHTSGLDVALAAVALGACVLEKHFTLDNNLPGPDHQASLSAGELADLVAGVRRVESALGDGVKRPAPAERDTAAVARKSLVAARDIAAGSVLEKSMLAVKRPGTGLPSAWLPMLAGRVLKEDVPAGALLKLEMLQ